MRLFISYARVDKPVCRQVVKALNDVHEIWFDEQLLVGVQWWEEIKYRIQWCDGFVFLLSPEAVASEYCLKEFDIARNLGKMIFPVLIQARTHIPHELGIYQYLDISDDHENIVSLIKALNVAERDLWQKKAETSLDTMRGNIDLSHLRIGQKISLATQAVNGKNYELAERILVEIQQPGDLPRDINMLVDHMLMQVRHGTAKDLPSAEVQQEYLQIVSMVFSPRTRSQGCDAFAKFAQAHPSYDPQDLKSLCRAITRELTGLFPPKPSVLPMPFEWCAVPGADISLSGKRRGQKPERVNAFFIAKYAVTNAQYNAFLKASDGYSNSYWWEYSPAALQWAEAHYTADLRYPNNNLPVKGISWYDCVAFTHWLSHQTGIPIRLPSEQEWQLASQGTDARRFPWGSDFSLQYSNPHPHQLVAVDSYPEGRSPYGLYNLIGNGWEWCLNARDTGATTLDRDVPRVIRGGTYNDGHGDVTTMRRLFTRPSTENDRIGFRLACDFTR